MLLCNVSWMNREGFLLSCEDINYKIYHQPRTWTASVFRVWILHTDDIWTCAKIIVRKKMLARMTNSLLHDIASDIENSWITWLETDWISKIFNATHKFSLCRFFHTPAASYKCLFTWLLEARGFLLSYFSKGMTFKILTRNTRNIALRLFNFSP